MTEHSILATFSMGLGKIAIARYRYTFAFNISGAGLVAISISFAIIINSFEGQQNLRQAHARFRHVHNVVLDRRQKQLANNAIKHDVHDEYYLSFIHLMSQIMLSAGVGN
uniref:Uncharacterized protein n=1 Tax=Glossina pallidipes TaxID=7398 RepID=A0A1A9ZBJ4_GLOPL